MSALVDQGAEKRDARWREDAAPHLRSAIAELECAVAAMPVTYERLLLIRALRTCTLSFRECTRNLDPVTTHSRSSQVGVVRV